MALQVSNYHTINGAIRAQRSTSTEQISQDYMPDAIGSVGRTVSPVDGASLSYARFSTYGRRFQTYISGTYPVFSWIGSLGYRNTSCWESNFYLRRREFSVASARFTSKVATLQYLLGENSYGYGLSNPATYADPSGLSPTYCLRRPPHSDCVKNSALYANSYQKTGNQFEKCAAKVSASICGLILAGRAEADAEDQLAQQLQPSLLPNFDPGLTAAQFVYTYENAQKLRNLANATLAQNQCMIDLWKKKDTPAWIVAHAVCQSYGQASKQCCTQSVLAEQNGYDICAKKVFPALGALPYNLRIHFALDVLKCCGN